MLQYNSLAFTNCEKSSKKCDTDSVRNSEIFVEKTLNFVSFMIFSIKQFKISIKPIPTQ